jgi:hypothetical protein
VRHLRAKSDESVLASPYIFKKQEVIITSLYRSISYYSGGCAASGVRLSYHGHTISIYCVACSLILAHERIHLSHSSSLFATRPGLVLDDHHVCCMSSQYRGHLQFSDHRIIITFRPAFYPFPSKVVHVPSSLLVHACRSTSQQRRRNRYRRDHELSSQCSLFGIDSYYIRSRLKICRSDEGFSDLAASLRWNTEREFGQP